jgi:hypothetical protein
MAFELSDGGKALLWSNDDQGFVFAALASFLSRSKSHKQIATALKHLRLSIDGPNPYDIHWQVKMNGQILTFRQAVDSDVFSMSRSSEAFADAPLSRIVATIECPDTGAFEFNAMEAYEQVVSIYSINWSNSMPYAPHIKANFLADGRAEQERFLDAFLYYYDVGSDVTSMKGAHDAATWLRERRRFVAQRTVVMRTEVVDVPRRLQLETTIRVAIEALRLECEMVRTQWALKSQPQPRSQSQYFSPLCLYVHGLQDLASDHRDGSIGEQVFVELNTRPDDKQFFLLAIASSRFLSSNGSPEYISDNVIATLMPGLLAKWHELEIATQAAFENGW